MIVAVAFSRAGWPIVVPAGHSFTVLHEVGMNRRTDSKWGRSSSLVNRRYHATDQSRDTSACTSQHHVDHP
jgi:hypothetical protein